MDCGYLQLMFSSKVSLSIFNSGLWIVTDSLEHWVAQLSGAAFRLAARNNWRFWTMGFCSSKTRWKILTIDFWSFLQGYIMIVMLYQVISQLLGVDRHVFFFFKENKHGCTDTGCCLCAANGWLTSDEMGINYSVLGKVGLEEHQSHIK